MKLAVGYLRVSTDSQRLEGVSLEAQRAKIEKWADANDFELHSIHEDAGLSGSRADNRPALQEALEQVTKIQGVLVVYSLSRLARSTRDTINISERLDKSGADLVSLSEKLDTTNAAGKMIFRLLAVLSEFERDLVGERTKAALAHLKSKNLRTGSVPYGCRLHKDGKTLVENKAEMRVVTRVLKLNETGHSLRRIIEELNAEGIKGRDGLTWHPQKVSNIIQRHGRSNV